MGCNTPPTLPEPGRPGQRTVFCVKFQREMPGLDEPPFDTRNWQSRFAHCVKTDMPVRNMF